MALKIGQIPDYRSVLAECKSAIDSAYSRLLEASKFELLKHINSMSPDEFELLVVKLLVDIRIGCRGVVTGRTGDGGIDGIIYVDRMGFDEIFIQVKRWRNKPVGRPDLQKFCGALTVRQAKKGVMITTSYFTDEARAYCSTLVPKVVLIDGVQLAEILYDADYFLAQSSVYEVKILRIK